jgi:hypothetical protein
MNKDFPIDIDLGERVFAMRDEFSSILDLHGDSIDGTLRVKLAKAELLLNRIGILIQEELK